MDERAEGESINLHEGHRERMYRKLLAGGESLTDCEVLEIALYGSIPRRNTNPLAHALLLKVGTLDNVFNAKAEELAAVAGVGKRTAEHIALIGQVLKRTRKSSEAAPKKFSFDAVKDYLFSYFENKDNEEFLAIFIDKRDTVTKISTVAAGDASHVTIDLTEFSKELSLSQPYAVLVAHNHPSGMPYPSKEDDDLTGKICFMLELAGAKFYDHIVVSKRDYYSYRLEGRLDKIQKKSQFSRFSDYLRGL